VAGRILRSPNTLLWVAALVVGLLFPFSSAIADEDDEYEFSRPFITEYPEADSELRLSFFIVNGDREPGRITRFPRTLQENGLLGRTHLVRLLAEYAFRHNASIEVEIPWANFDPVSGSSVSHFGDIELGLKFVTSEDEDRGTATAFGLEVKAPTGSNALGIGSDTKWELEPFVVFGKKHGRWETIGVVRLGFILNEPAGEASETELGFDVSVLRHLSERWEALVEVNGEHGLRGEEAGATLVTITPGLKWRPSAHRREQIGVGASFPVTGPREFASRVFVMLFKPL